MTPGPSPHSQALTLALAKAPDTDADGLLSRTELESAVKSLLAKFDADRDDCLTPLEIIPGLLTRQPVSAAPHRDSPRRTSRSCAP